MNPDVNNRPANFSEILEDMLEMKSRSTYEFFLFCTDIKLMAGGSDAFGWREFYPGWEDADFQELLDAVDGESVLNDPEASSPRFYDEILERFRARKIKDRLGHYEAVTELMEMAKGGDPSHLRKGYPGWTDEHFRRLLRDMGEEEDY